MGLKLKLSIGLISLVTASISSATSIDQFIDQLAQEETLTVSCEYQIDIFKTGDYVKTPRIFVFKSNRRPLQGDSLSTYILNGGMVVKDRDFGGFTLNEYTADNRGNLVNISNRPTSSRTLTVSADPLSVEIIDYKPARSPRSGPSNSGGLGTPGTPASTKIEYMSNDCSIL